MAYMQNAIIVMVQMLLGFYIFIAALRFVLQSSDVDFYNPISMMVATLTNPPLRLLHLIFPRILGLDTASLALLFIATCSKYILLQFFTIGELYWIFIFALSLSESLNTIIWIFLFSVFASAILSWFATGSRHPVINIINSISDKVLLPIRRLIPSFSGIDLSPIFAILALRLLQLLVVDPLKQWAIPFFIN